MVKTLPLGWKLTDASELDMLCWHVGELGRNVGRYETVRNEELKPYYIGRVFESLAEIKEFDEDIYKSQVRQYRIILKRMKDEVKNR